MNWLPVPECMNEYICPNVFKLFDEAWPFYMHNIHM